MFLKAIFSLIFFLQCLSPFPAKRSIIEVLHANQDVITFTQFIKTDGLFLTFQQYGPVSFLSPTSGIFESFLEIPFGNDMVADEYLVNQAHLNLLTIGSHGRHLLQYQVINGTCSIHDYKNERIRLGTYIYSKETSSVVRQVVGNTKYGALKVVSSDSANGIIHVLEKPALTDNLPLFLGMTAHKLLNEMNTSLLYETDLGPLLSSVIKDTISEQPLDKNASVQYGLTKNVISAANGIMDLEFIKALQCSFHKLLHLSVFKSPLVDQQLNHKLKTTMSHLLSKMFTLYDFPEGSNTIINSIYHSTGFFESLTSQKKISQNAISKPLTCPKEILNLKYGTCLNEPIFNGIFYNDLKSNGFSISNITAHYESTLFDMSLNEKLEYDVMVPSLEIVPRSTLFSRFLKYIAWIFKGFQYLFGFVTHFKFISGAFSTLAIRPILLSWTQRTLEKREQQVMERREYRRQKRENWIAMKSSSPHTLSP